MADAYPARRERYWLVLSLLVGLTHGLVYVFLMPPWQHYEEPSHFEYAWLISSRGALPEYPAFDPVKRREIVASMIAHGFYYGMGFLPDLNSDAPLDIGINVTGAPPLYAILVAIPLRVLASAPVEIQLYAGRLISLSLYLLTLWLSYKIVSEITPPGHLLRWGVPVSIAVVPAFTDLMTAINNDVGATAVFSLFLWGAVRLIMRGLSLGRLAWVLGMAALCIMTKNTVLAAIPLAGVAVALASFQWKWWPLVVGSMALAGVLVIGLVFAWGDAALWLRETAQAGPTRARRLETSLGQYALALTMTHGSPAPQVKQRLPQPLFLSARGKTVTLGAWVWATTPVKANLPALFNGRTLLTQSVEVSTKPKFYAFQAVLSDEATQAYIVLRPGVMTDSLTVYYDGVVAAVGEWPLEATPVFDDVSSQAGRWAGLPFTNLARNSSAESAGPWIRPKAEAVFKIFAEAHLSPSVLLTSLLDVEVSGAIYRYTVQTLFRTFWARFGWGHVPVPTPWYWAIAVMAVLGVMGAVPALWQLYRLKQWPLNMALIFLALAAALIWSAALLRGLFSLVGPSVYIPTARYAYPAIIPTMGLITVGWWRAGRHLGSGRVGLALWLVFCGLLDVISIHSIYYFYLER